MTGRKINLTELREREPWAWITGRRIKSVRGAVWDLGNKPSTAVPSSFAPSGLVAGKDNQR